MRQQSLEIMPPEALLRWAFVRSGLARRMSFERAMEIAPVVLCLRRMVEGKRHG